MKRRRTPLDLVRLRLPLLLELAPERGCFAHLPRLPGLCFRADERASVESAALEEVKRYGQWLLDENAADLTPETTRLVRCLRAGSVAAVEVRETECRIGSPLWLSGNPAVLFRHDRRPLSDAVTAAHLRFVRLVIACIRRIVAPLSDLQLAWKLDEHRRSIDETLTHIGNCVWWYCSRIDDDLAEPEERTGERAVDRMDRLLDIADAYLPQVPLEERVAVHVPGRFASADPTEAWTHAKVCRRQAEHVWEHLPGISRAVKEAQEAIV